jgi:RNA polymerase sigma-70 factor (ECF subfamily)
LLGPHARLCWPLRDCFAALQHESGEKGLGLVKAESAPVGSQTNLELCASIRHGSERAEALLVSRLEPGLRLVLHRATRGDRELSQELCQDTLIIVLQRLRTSGLQDPLGLSAFAAQTARNLAIAHHRKVLRRQTDADDTAIEMAPTYIRGQEEELDTGKAAELVRRLLRQLPNDRDRLVLTRYYLNEEDKATICEELKLTEISFNQILFRARNRFRELVDASGYGKDLHMSPNVANGP